MNGRTTTARCRWGRGSKGGCCCSTAATLATNYLIVLTEKGGYFITRLATNADSRIRATHRQWRGRAIELEGKRLKEVASRLQRDVLEVEVEVAFQRRVYAGTRRTVRRRLRLVAVRPPESNEYRFYPTNIDPDSLDAHSVARTYATRWQIELIFQGVEISLSPR